MKLWVQVVCGLWCAAFLAVAVGCSEKADASKELEKAVAAFEQPPPAEPSEAAPVSSVETVRTEAALAPASAPPPPAAEPAGRDVSREMSQALSSYRNQNYMDAVNRLQWLRSQAPKTPDQAMAVQDALAAVMSELAERAEKGDEQAKQALDHYVEMKTSR